ncbi:Protein of unknown function [Pyronema omphalodes CBS 100304]|uniref:Uncharacterized protein n=1 Tax=Pyronema omphalodes (strain CBS 100304) TaxID=1076935 RepID=U4LCT0_PYROM|nr:Protein of unknown function [Pyronema omphalodes CBS 100304]
MKRSTELWVIEFMFNDNNRQVIT